MSFAMIMKNQNVMKQQNCVIWTQLHCIHKNMIFIKKLQKILKQVLILQIMNQIDHCQRAKNKKVIGLMKDELDGK